MKSIYYVLISHVSLLVNIYTFMMWKKERERKGKKGKKEGDRWAVK